MAAAGKRLDRRSAQDMEDLFRLVVDAAPNGMMMADTNGTIVLVNVQLEKMFGYSRPELLGQPVEMLLPMRVRAAHASHRAQFVSKPTTRSMGAGRELYGRRKDGTEFPVEVGLNPIQRPSGVYVLGAVVDISERKRMEEHFRAVVEAAPNGMLAVDDTGAIVMVNAQVEKMFGYTRAELLSKSVEMLVPERLRAAHVGFRASFGATPAVRSMGAGREVYGVRKDGSEFPLELGLNPLALEGGGKLTLAAIVDITDRRRLEERFRLVVEASSSGMVMTDRDGRIALVNRCIEQLFQYPRNELVGESIEKILPGSLAVYRDASVAPVVSASSKASGLSVDRQPSPPVAGSPASPAPVPREVCSRRKDGTEFTADVTMTPIKTAEGDMVLSCLVDTTHRKQLDALDRARLVAQRDAADLQARSQLLATMSHEIRTPLTGIIGCIDLLEDARPANPAQGQGPGPSPSPGPGDRSQQLFGTIRCCADVLLNIVNDVLDFSKLEAGQVALERVPLSPYTLTADVGGILGQRVKMKGLDFRVEIDPRVPQVVLGDPSRLRQVLLNLVGNAVKFTHQGAVTIALRCLPLLAKSPDPDLNKMESHASDQLLEFAVVDTGVGIPHHLLEKLFHPFVQADRSTTRQYGGTGLGLVISKKLVELMGGHIDVSSVAGQGSQFTFTARVGLCSGGNNAATTPEAAPGQAPHVYPPALVASEPSYACEPDLALLTLNGMATLATAEQGLAPFCTVSANPPELLPLSLPTSPDGQLSVAVEPVRVARASQPSDAAPLASVDNSALAVNEPASAPNVRQTVADVHALLPAADTRLKVLLADDDPVNRTVVTAMVQRIGYLVTAVVNGAEAIDAVQTGAYDLVLLDQEMPVADGQVAARTIRQLGYTLPIIAMTANAMMGDRELCLSAGMNDYLAKPLRLAQLRECLTRWSEHAQASTCAPASAAPPS